MWRSKNVWSSGVSCVALALSLSACGPDPLVFDECKDGEACDTNRTTGNNSTTPPNNTTSNNFNPNNTSTFDDMGTDDLGAQGDGCELDITECVDGQRFRQCVPDGLGGTVWSAPSFCEYAICVDETGLCCEAPCPSLGAKKCGGGGVQTCVESNGCQVWSEPEACLEGSSCSGAGECKAGCQSSCTANEQKCVVEGGSEYQRCEDVGGGCLQFSASTFNCGNGGSCMGGECISMCTNACSTMGDKRCNGSNEQECVRGSDGCLDWANTGNNAACGPMCTDRCTQENATRCNNNTEQKCVRQATGCLDWNNTGASCGNLAGCNSATLGRPVDHGECVQTSSTNMTGANCPDRGCLWAYCNNGAWEYQCSRTNPGPCANNPNRYPHNTCN